MRIYTKTGDDGETGLLGGRRIRKDDPRIEAYGTVDELNAVLGLVRSLGLPQREDEVILRVQNRLFDLGACLANPGSEGGGNSVIGSAEISWLEQMIDSQESGLQPLSQFILPCGTMLAASLHLARCVCRRAERLVVALARQESIPRELVIYLNRLGDLFFVLARSVNQRGGEADVPWQRDG